MKPGPLIKDLLTFNRMELRGVVVLLTLYFALLAGTFIVPALIPEKPADFKGFEKEVNDFMKALARLDSEEALSKEKKYGSYRKFAAGALPDTAKFPTYKKEKILVELNSADTFDLQRLPGIGPSFAKRIVKYRERLGGFRNKKQVLEVWGMDTARYNRISENLSVNTDSVHRIDLNKATFKELLFHPYFSFEVAKAIMTYRKEHKQFQRVDEIRSIQGIADSTYRKIFPYIKIIVQ